MGCCDPDAAGAQNVQIQIQNNPRPDDGYGGFDNTDAAWADKLVTWAKMRQANGREIFANRQTEGRALYVFEIDYPLAVTVELTDRVLYGTRAFDIQRVDNVDQANMTLKIYAEEGRPD